MRIWIVQDGEPLPGIDEGTRDWRCGILAKALVANGHEVLWWASTFDHDTKRHRFTESTTVEIMPRLQVRLLQGPGYQKNRSPRRILHNRRLARSFASEAANSARPHVIFSSLPTPELAEQVVMYGRRTGIPVFVDVRDLWPDHYLTLVPRQLRGVWRVALSTEFRRTEWLLKNASAITSISKTFLEWALQRSARPRREDDGVFPMSYPSNSLPEEDIVARQQELSKRYAITPDTLIVSFVGAINSIFDFETVIQVARDFERTEKNVRFVFVGDGTSYAKVRAQAVNLANMVMTGRLDQVSVAAMLRLTSVGLAPYAKGRSISGSVPNKAFEYMSSGLPLLSCHQGDLAHLIAAENIGLQYQTKDGQSLAEGVRWMKNHPQRRIEMGRRARRLFQDQFSPEIVYTGLAAHIERVANNWAKAQAK